jgi:1-aminocyclopropane-1-carboxylate deaminase
MVPNYSGHEKHNALIPPESINIDTATSANGAFEWKVLRLDQLHPVVSGNKPFKLSCYLKEAKACGHRGVLTFGGAWSNHIHATAHASREEGLESIGIIRGERPADMSPTLLDAEQAGMELRFVSRSDYRAFRNMSHDELKTRFPDHTIVPEGGAGEMGMQGAADIMRYIPEHQFDWIVCACGTGTTLAGLITAAKKEQRFLGISVLKGHSGLKMDINQMLNKPPEHIHYEIIEKFNGGGYAKYDDDLIDFMNRFHRSTGIPTDIVYTGKLMRAIDLMFSENFFPSDARVIAIHSGGLQGNRSLPAGRLHF